MDDSEEFLLAMEKLSVIFERLKTCHSFEAQQICNVLPHFLCVFFPTQDILNKCIGEFLSGQQIHTKHLANILFVVFFEIKLIFSDSLIQHFLNRFSIDSKQSPD